MRNRFRTVHVVVNTLGSLFIVLGGFLLVPLIVVVVTGELHQNFNTFFAFVLPSGVSFSLGILCKTLFRGKAPTMLQAMLICALGWPRILCCWCTSFCIWNRRELSKRVL